MIRKIKHIRRVCGFGKCKYKLLKKKEISKALDGDSVRRWDLNGRKEEPIIKREEGKIVY